ncbi:MAG: glycosyltransferase [Anaerolineae bacterium]|nr:glycosyltransferase [Anaerolineae bacterium]
MPTQEYPLVSIVIPSYNHKQYVWQTVDSCLTQTYPHCEIIVVDDGSTDGTGEMLKQRYGDRIRYICQDNRGLPVARNVGTQAARGDFIHYCDADDQLLPQKVARCMDVLLDNPDVTLVYTHCEYVEADGRTVIPRPQPELPSGDVFCELLAGPRGNFIPQCTPLIRRQAVLDAGGFCETIRSAHDWDLWLRLAAQHRFAFINEALARYRVLPHAMHTDPVRMSEARLRVIQRARDYPGRERCMDAAAYDRLEANRHHRLAMAYWQTGQRTKARQAFRAAIRLDPSHAAIRRLYAWLTILFPARSADLIGRISTGIKGTRGKKGQAGA